MLRDGPNFLAATVRIAIAAVLAAFFYSLLSFYLFGGRFLWIERPGVTISDIDIATGDTVTPDMLLSWIGMERDAPMFPGKRGFFSNNLRSVHERVMANPTLASLSISRHYSGRLVVRSTERTPVARLGNRGLAIDAEGNVFTFRKAGIEGLVAIEGGVPSSLMPGNRVVPSSLDASREAMVARGRTVPSAMTIAALRLIDCLSDGSTPLPLSAIRSINVDSGDYVRLFFKDGRTATFAWECMKSSLDTDGREYLEAQLKGLHGTMSSREGRAHRNFDFTIKGRGYGQ